MKKLMIAVLAGFLSTAVGAYAAEDMKKDEPKKAAKKAAKAEPKGEADKGDMKAEKKGRRARAAKG